MAQIHPTAIVDAGAELADSVTVGPYAVIGPHVRIGARTTVGAHCVIEGHTTIGEDNRLWHFCSLGGAPQDKKYAGEPTRLEIGHRNTVREFCTFNTGTAQDAGVTRVGDDNWIMAYVHIAHDCQVGQQNILANNATLAGHVHVGNHVTIGGLTGILQRMRIGDHAMIGFQAHVAQDVPPFMTVDGHPLAVRAVNLTGLKRRDFSAERIGVIRQIYKLLYRMGHTLDEAKAAIAALRGTEGGAADGDIDTMLTFLAASTRGIVR